MLKKQTGLLLYNNEPVDIYPTAAASGQKDGIT